MSSIEDVGNAAEIKTDPNPSSHGSLFSIFSWFFILGRGDSNYYICIYLVINTREKKQRKGGGV